MVGLTRPTKVRDQMRHPVALCFYSICCRYLRDAMERRVEGDDLDRIMTKVRRSMAFETVVGHDAVDGQVSRTPGMPDCNNRQVLVSTCT